VSKKCWWILKDDGRIVQYADGSALIYPTKAAAKKDLAQCRYGPKVTIERVWLEWEVGK